MVWRLVGDVYCMTPLGDHPCDVDPEAFDRASTITILDFYVFRVLLNIECNSVAYEGMDPR